MAGSARVVDENLACGIPNEKMEPFPTVLDTQIVAAELMQDLAADRQSEARTLRFVGEYIAGLLEPLEYLALVLGCDADAIVDDIDPELSALLPGADRDQPFRLVAELDGVGDQIDDDLDEAVPVDADRRQVSVRYPLPVPSRDGPRTSRWLRRAPAR